MNSPFININIGNHRKHLLKVACAKENLSMREAIIKMIDQHLKNEPKQPKNNKNT